MCGLRNILHVGFDIICAHIRYNCMKKMCIKVDWPRCNIAGLFVLFFARIPPSSDFNIFLPWNDPLHDQRKNNDSANFFRRNTLVFFCTKRFWGFARRPQYCSLVPTFAYTTSENALILFVPCETADTAKKNNPFWNRPNEWMNEWQGTSSVYGQRQMRYNSRYFPRSKFVRLPPPKFCDVREPVDTKVQFVCQG